MNGLIKAIALGVVRSLAMALGGYLLSKGYLDASTVTGVEGSICCLAAAGFSIWDKFGVNDKIVAAFNAPAPAVPAKSVNFAPTPVAGPVTMAPIPNPA